MSKQPDKELIDCLRNLLSQGRAQTQEDLKVALQQHGYEANQSKISRLLRKLGAIKTVGTHQESVYQLPWEPEPPAKDMRVHRLVIDIQRNETLIVVRASPGSASLIARVLDCSSEQIGCLGTVAGDDTIFVIPLSITTIEETFQKVKALLL